MEEKIELHDSEIHSIERDAGSVTIRARFYIHKREDIRHSGWMQSAVLTFQNASVDGIISRFPALISDGSLTTNSEAHENLIPLPCDLSSGVLFRVITTENQQLSVRAAFAGLLFVGDPEFIEEISF